ncbi:ATP-dependent RecD-like DNA helicase (plasmid) [Skermanella sp. TT6]|uniref:ATP-dependent RecD2 DNA helicase n=1 Tax=Skermanella cutis TaxID=2775420 RepID=A0ABX7BG04_9PROT|nr:ATP-dependent RecD-like DNA helicase [Skermanella sp. TT6]QQP93325.1 ATP-dependent RecD-like DNA helicase [Skermanella sp. TT6]
MLVGTVERVTFHNAETGFCVLRVQVRGRRELTTVVGRAAAITPGERIQATGQWINDRSHGLQFQASFLNSAPPASSEGIEKYLSSGLIRGIGPIHARKLIAAFGDAVFEVIETEPGRLRQVPGIGPQRARQIIEGWAEQRAVREIMIFLHEHRISTARSVRIYRLYGSDAIRLITENPYRLARDVRGIGFLSADRIAAAFGIARDSPLRIRAGLSHVLSGAMAEGHCGLPRAELIETAAKVLEVETGLVGQGLAEEVAEGTLVEDTIGGQPAVFLGWLFHSERNIAGRLSALCAGPLPWSGIDVARAIPWVEARAGISLAPSQAAALRQALRAKVLVITGGPGVGKTTLVNSIIRILTAKGVRILLAAPTGRAAKRMTEATGLEARTLHRLLEVDPRTGGFKRAEETPLDGDLLVVDEASMVDVPLMYALLKAVPPGMALLLVGDVDQLPSVGPGRVLGDIIDGGVVPVVRLTEVFRQAANSRIITNAHRINTGKLPLLPGRGETSDFHWLDADTPEQAVRAVVHLVARHLPRRQGYDPIRDIQVLCPMNVGSVGARSLNIELQRAINPPGAVRVERFGFTFSMGDKVMQIVNDYDKEVYNGDIGRVASVDPDRAELVIRFDERDVPYRFEELDQVVLAYATTIHKSQGSEYPVVVIPVMLQHLAMLHRNLLYTGVTRGKRLVILVGEKRACAVAVYGTMTKSRHTKLGEWVLWCMEADEHGFLPDSLIFKRRGQSSGVRSRTCG